MQMVTCVRCLTEFSVYPRALTAERITEAKPEGGFTEKVLVECPGCRKWQIVELAGPKPIVLAGSKSAAK